MPQYRIPFFGTVLVEADSEVQAEVSAGSWVRSMKQSTHGVEVERPTEGKICALDLWIHQQHTDVTRPFAAYAEEDRVFREQQDPEIKEACHENYHVGVQLAWELFERGERAGKIRDQNGA